ncbi:DUF58 domain-containing protein [Haloplanus salilacus]|uniref:DUF58 domain-containing protein n=1 Tax=Haloplanus salilacus TaxID=2949994 RepID=UPI0030D1AD44
MLPIRPTRRGLAVALAAAAGVAMAVRFGPRSLDAVVVAATVALVAAVVQLAAVDAPEVDRTTPPPSVPGTTGVVGLAVATDTPATAVVTDRLPAGVGGTARAAGLVGDGADPLRYEITYRERGEHAVGPATVRIRDLLGLAERTFVGAGEDPVLVYPRVYRPSPAVAERLRALSTSVASAERGAFDHLREYARGDSLRDIHWKASAKRDDLVVQEFADDEGDCGTVTVAASGASGHADAMAEATASVGIALLDSGVGVALVSPDGRLTATPGEADGLLAHLARVDAGHPDDEAADVVVDATAEGVTIRVDGERSPFDPGRRVRTSREEVMA